MRNIRPLQYACLFLSSIPIYGPSSGTIQNIVHRQTSRKVDPNTCKYIYIYIYTHTHQTLASIVLVVNVKHSSIHILEVHQTMTFSCAGHIYTPIAGRSLSRHIYIYPHQIRYLLISFENLSIFNSMVNINITA